MSKFKLLPCPFCGPQAEEGKSVVLLECREGDFARGYTVRCDGCGIEHHAEYESEVAAEWNKRTPLAPASDEAIVAGAAAYERLNIDTEGEHDPEEVARVVIAASLATTQPTTQPADVTETAKRIAWAMLEDEDKDRFQTADGAWASIERLGLEGQYIAAARAVTTAPMAADKLAMERDLSRTLMDLLKAIHEATTMADGYEILADFTEHAGLGVPVALRSPQPQPDAALVEASPENDTPVRCTECNWCGRADELGPEGECGGEGCPGTAVSEITEPADLIEAWQDTEGQIGGSRLADAGLIAPQPATVEEAKNLDLEPGDTVWAVTEAGYAALRTARQSGKTEGEGNGNV